MLETARTKRQIRQDVTNDRKQISLIMKLIRGNILLPRHEIRQKIPVDLTNIIRCCMATKQLLHRDKAIAASRQSNQQNSITLIT